MAGFDDQGRLYVSDSAGVNLRFPQLSEAAPHRIVRLARRSSRFGKGSGRVRRAAIEDIREGRTSIMPAGLDRQLAREELRDLPAFLASLC
ncbi:MAG TPA: hypothetical protein VNO22_11725 [Planctomycetota bacterium]|nr:hypothetical protein [Planctomycetota bacterium]